MRKKFLGLGVVAVVVIAATMSCSGITFSGKGVGAVYGKVFNGLTRAVITSAADTSLAGKLTYYDPDKNQTVTVDASFSGDYYYFSKIPTATPYEMTFTATDVQMWSYSTTTGISEVAFNANAPAGGATAGGSTWFVGNDPATLGNVYLYPSNVNPGDVTLKILDQQSGSLIKAAGTVLLVPSAASGLGSTAGHSNELVNQALLNSTVQVSATLKDGSVDVPGTSLTLGASYTIQVYGVDGYNATTSGGTLTPTTSSKSTQSVSLTSVAPLTQLKITGYSDIVPSYGTVTYKQTPAGTTLTITFNQAIELDPYTADLAEITSVSAPDTNGNGTTSSLTAFAGTVNPAKASNQLSVAVSGSGNNMLTITVLSTAITTEDTGDKLGVFIDTKSIGVRLKGSSDSYTTLDNFVTTGTVGPDAVTRSVANQNNHTPTSVPTIYMLVRDPSAVSPAP